MAVRLVCLAIVATLAVAMGAVPPGASASPLQRWFWVAGKDGWQHLACDQIATGTHLTLYRCGGAQILPRDAGRLARAFDGHIFPVDTADFGRPRGLTTVNVVIAPLNPMTSGYFDENDLDRSPVRDVAHSNNGNVLYLQSLDLMPDPNRLADAEEALAHELQHLINYRIRVLDDGFSPQEVWLNEGLSFYAQMANGYWTPRDSLKLQAAAAEPTWPVTALNEGSGFLRQHARVAYGRAGLFLTYLGAQYGPDFSKDVLADPRPGMGAIDDVIRQSVPHRSVGDEFARWAVAQLLNRPGEYGFGRFLRGRVGTPKLALPAVATYPFDSDLAMRGGITLQPWSQRYVRLAVGGRTPVRVQVSAAPGLRVAAVFRAGQAAAPTVRWLHVGAYRGTTLMLGGSGSAPRGATIVASSDGPLSSGAEGRSLRLRITAGLVDARQHHRMAGSAPSARRDAHFNLPKLA